jgi:hypothetical protein
MHLPPGNPFLRRHRRNVTALMLNCLRSIGPVTHWDPCDEALIIFDVEPRRSRCGLAIDVFAAFRELHLMGIS